jgi:hypothetical protein
MMPTSPPPPLRFRTVGFPQYGSKASLSARACPGGDEVKPTPGMPSSPAEFASRLRDAGGYGIGTQPVAALPGNPARSSLPAPPLTPGVLGSGRVVLSRPSSLIRPHAPVSGAPGDFTVVAAYTPGLRWAGAPEATPETFPTFPAALSLRAADPTPVGSPPPPVVLGRTITGFLALGPSRHPQPRLCQQYPTGAYFDAASFALCCGPQVCLALLAGSDAGSELTPLASRGLCHPRFGPRASRPEDEGQARLVNGKPPIIRTFTGQVTTGSEAAP